MHRRSVRAHRLSLRFATLLLALASPAARALAQNPPPPPPVLDSVLAATCSAGCDVVRGVVFDSLTSEPLAGAIVTALPSGVSITTDSVGKFMFMSERRVERLIAYHSALDQSGLGALVLQRPERGEWNNALLSTPSLLTLWPKLCGEKRPVAARSVILTGTAQLSDNQTRVAGARIMVQWPKPMYSVGSGSFRTEEATTDSLGNYLICGIETFVDLSLLATSSEAQSGVITIPSDRMPLRRIDLVMARAGAARVSLRGHVIGDDGKPLDAMRVSLDGAEGEVVTDADGAFAFANVSPGSRMLSVRAIGYSPVAQWIEVFDGQNTPQTVQVSKPFTLEGVTITAKISVRRDRQEFEMRKMSGWGRIIDSTQIRRVPHLRAALSMIPGINVRGPQYGRSGDFEVFGRQGCRAATFVDGVLDQMELASFIPKDDIAAIEVYTSSAMAPSRFIMVRQDNCPVVLFWTKYGLRP